MKGRKVMKQQEIYTISEPLSIHSAEKRIIENCIVEITAAIKIYGKMIIRNSTITIKNADISIFGTLKIEKCNVSCSDCKLNIAHGGEYLFDLLYIDPTKETIICSENGKMSWIPHRQSIETYLCDTILSCAATYYDLEDDTLKSSSKDKKQTSARYIAIYLTEKLTNVPLYKIAQEYNIYYYLMYDKLQDIRNYILSGDKQLWIDLTYILEAIIEKMYSRDLEEEKTYPYRD